MRGVEKDREQQAAAANMAAARLWVVGASILGGFILAATALVVSAFKLGQGVLTVDREVSAHFSVWEVTSGAAMGVITSVIGLGAAVVGAVSALAAGIVAAVAAVFGGAAAIVVICGMVLGPLLLLGLIAILIKRRFWPDVI